MDEINIGVTDYKVFENATSNTIKFNEEIASQKEQVIKKNEELQNEAVFQGPICDNVLETIQLLLNEFDSDTDRIKTINTYLNDIYSSYTKADYNSLKKLLMIEDSTEQIVDVENHTVQVGTTDNNTNNNLVTLADLAALNYGNVNNTSNETVNQSTSTTNGTFHNYYQGDYANVKYGSSGTIASAGCGPTSLAMILQYKTGKTIDPTVTAAYAVQHNYRKVGSGTVEDLFPAMAQEYGLSCTQEKQTPENITNALKSGKVLLLHMKHGTFSNGIGHYIVAKGITSDGQVIIADPASKSRSNKTWSVNKIASETKPVKLEDNLSRRIVIRR